MVVKLKSLSRREDCNQEVTLRWLWVFLGGAHSCLTTTGGPGHAKAVEWMGVKNQVETPSQQWCLGTNPYESHIPYSSYIPCAIEATEHFEPPEILGATCTSYIFFVAWFWFNTACNCCGVGIISCSRVQLVDFCADEVSMNHDVWEQDLRHCSKSGRRKTKVISDVCRFTGFRTYLGWLVTSARTRANQPKAS